jgi:hypothetical protein
VGAANGSRPGLAEVLAVWILYGIVAVMTLITYSRLPVGEFYNVSHDGLAGGAGRALVFLNYSTALIVIALLAIVGARLRGRLALVAAIGAALCAVVYWPGVVDQSNLDARPINAVPALGVLIAVVLTGVALARGGVGASRPFGGSWDVARVVVAAVLLFGALPWILADAGFYIGRIPVLGSLFMSDELIPEPGHPRLHAVHLGHHHGWDGVLLALSSLALSRVVTDVRPPALRFALGFYLALGFAYGLAISAQDFWLEQLFKRGTTSLRIPTMTVPEVSWAWAAIIAAALLIHFVARGVGRFGKPPEEGVP